MSAQVWRFADCEFDDARYELRVAGRPVDVEVKPLDVLRTLLLHAGEVVTKDELLDAVWSDATVVDGSLATAVSKLRKALGSSADAIVTVPRVGYRLGVSVQRLPVAEPAWEALQLAAGAAVPGRNQWRLVRRFDLSPSSEVWLAEHPKTRDQRVFKFARDAAQLRGLKREVTVARLIRQSLGDHASFVRLFEWNFDTFPFFIESEYCGPDLREWFDTHPGANAVSRDTRLRLVEGVASAMHEAHLLGVLHKDLKPANLLVATDASGAPFPKIADFGSASMLDPERLSALGITTLGFTQSTRSASGTLTYVAPELLRGHAPTPASDVYSLGVLLYQLVVGDFQRAPAPGWESDIDDAVLTGDIAAAANGDPSRRLQTAGELATRLRTLEERRAVQRAAAAAGQPADRIGGSKTSFGRWGLGAAIVAMAVTIGMVTRERGPNVAESPRPVASVVVLPFENASGDDSLEYLRLALADEVATVLSHARGVAVRPSIAHPSGGDPGATARVRGVDHVVRGRFVSGGGRLTLSLEAVQTEPERLIWRDSIDGPLDQLMATRVQLTLRLRGGLLRALGASSTQSGPEPRNAEAYDLYLRSIALATDADVNRQGIALLERAVALDAGYAPAWQALSKRYYINARYGDGAGRDINRFEAAATRAADLDPDFVAPAAGLVVGAVERGDLAGALRRALPLIARRPDSVDAHFALSYAYRFGGQLDAAAAHCEEAFLLDQRNATSGLRSCAFAFLLRGDYPRAVNYLHLDQGSQWEKALTIHMLIRQGKPRDALLLGEPLVPQWHNLSLLRACAGGGDAADVERLAAAVAPSPDPETNYLLASHLSYCGQVDRAEALVSRAIAGGYCSYPVLDDDPLFSNLRLSPAFASLRDRARACHDRFVSDAATIKS